MPRYALFVAVPYFGHLNPLLRQAVELRRRGWRTAVATMDELRPAVEAVVGPADFLSLGQMYSGNPRRRAALMARTTDASGLLKQARLILQALTDAWEQMYDGVLAAIRGEPPDVVVVDLFSGAVAAAETAGVPCIINNPSLLPMIPRSSAALASGRAGGTQHRPVGARDGAPGARAAACRRALGRGLVRLHVRTPGQSNASSARPSGGNVQLVATTGGSDGGLRFWVGISPFATSVGPYGRSHAGRPNRATRAGVRLLDRGRSSGRLRQLGAVSWPAAGFLQRLLGGLASESFRALWVLRPELQASLVKPSNLRFEPWVSSQVGVLAHPNVRAFISHCGINSAHEALYHGTPIVGIPFLGDQKGMAMRVRDAGVGLALDYRHLTSDELRRSVERVLFEPEFARRLPAIQETFRQAGGIARAADLIERRAAAVGPVAAGAPLAPAPAP